MFYKCCAIVKVNVSYVCVFISYEAISLVVDITCYNISLSEVSTFKFLSAVAYNYAVLCY